MTACGYCNAVNGPAAHYCRHCGATRAAAPPPPATAVASGPESNIIPMKSLLLLTFDSYSAYLFYWFYRPWRQYRDHTGDIAYPVWHALTWAAPTYGWFRIYAHAKACRPLVAVAGRPDTIIPVLPVLLFIFQRRGAERRRLPLYRPGPGPPGPSPDRPVPAPGRHGPDRPPAEPSATAAERLLGTD